MPGRHVDEQTLDGAKGDRHQVEADGHDVPPADKRFRFYLRPELFDECVKVFERLSTASLLRYRELSPLLLGAFL